VLIAVLMHIMFVTFYHEMLCIARMMPSQHVYPSHIGVLSKWLHISSNFLTIWQPQCQLTQKWYKTEVYLQWPTNRKSYIVYRTSPFSMTLNDSNLNFKVAPLFNAECLWNGDSYNEVLTGTYAFLKSVISNDIAWSWVT